MAHFLRRRPPPPNKRGYRSYLPFVREDFRRTCAYCLMKELFAGGPHSFELDHFRPQSLFPGEADNFYNLYYACRSCNLIKHVKWPPPELEQRCIGFVDFCADRFEDHFTELADGKWLGLTPSAQFTIDMLLLNRTHLVSIRLLMRRLQSLGFQIDRTAQ